MTTIPFLSEIKPEAFDAISASLSHFSVELQVVFAALCIFLIDLFLPQRFSKHLAWLAIFACLLPLKTLTEMHAEPSDHRLFMGMLSLDSYSNFYKAFFLLGSIPVILLSYLSKSLEGRRMGEYYGILLASVFGAMLMASSTHFLMIFLALELLSFASYILVGYRRSDKQGVEAALKYLIYGSVASAVMLFGMSLYYGLTGSGDLAQLAAIVDPARPIGDNAQLAFGLTAFISLLLIFLGIAYKISAVPMHFWAPDAYEGAPTPVTAFLSVLSKAAGFALALRLFQSLAVTVTSLAQNDAAWRIWHEILGVPNGTPWLLVIMMIAVLTMTVGNLAALWQTNLKRLLAYSSIAHAGYMMMGLTLLSGLEGSGLEVGGLEGGGSHADGSSAGAMEIGGIGVISFYLIAYLAMNFGAFAVILFVENRKGSCDIVHFRGLGKKAPFLAAAMVVFVFSLIGIPPTGGFTGKFQLFMGVVKVGRIEYYLLAIAAAINTAISAYYYLRIVKEMYFTESEDNTEITYSGIGTVLVAAMVLLTFYLFFYADGLLQTARNLKLEL